MINIEEIYKYFIEEAEAFHVTKFIRSDKIDKAFKKAFGIIFDPKSVRGVIAYHEKYGQGKTFFFDVIHSLVKKKLNKNLFLRTSSKELVEIYKTSGEENLLKFIEVRNLFIDDIGAEIKDGKVITKNFGNSLNVIEYVIFKRYEMWQEKGWKLHGTTNISLGTIGELYGGRVADRFVQMCEIIEFNFTTTSFRQVKNVRPLIESEKKANLEKLYPKKTEEVDKVDLIEYVNELIDDSEELTRGRPISFWTFVRIFLEKQDLVIYTEITDRHLEGAESLARSEIRRGVQSLYKNMDPIVANMEREKEYKALEYKSLMNLARNVQVRNLILKMKSNKEKFNHEKN